MSHTNQAAQKMDRGLKFWIKEVEGFYYLFSENICKGAGQLCINSAADLGLCFPHLQRACFSCHSSIYIVNQRI